MRRGIVFIILCALGIGLVIATNGTRAQARAKQEAIAQRLEVEAADREARNQALATAKEERLRTATDEQIGELGTQCVQAISNEMAKAHAFEWSFIDQDGVDWSALEYYSMQNVPFTAQGLWVSYETAAKQASDSAITTKETYPDLWPVSMYFYITRTDDSLIGLRSSLRKYHCYLTDIDGVGVVEGGAILIPRYRT